MRVMYEVNTPLTRRLDVPRETGILGVEDTVGSRIRALQRATRVTNEELAAAAGVHVKTVSQWRHDKQRPTPDNLQAISPLLNTTMGHLLTAGSVPGATAEDRHREALFLREASREGYRADAPLTLPSKVHAHAHRLLAQLADDGADEHSLDQAKRLFLEPERYTYSAHGRIVMMEEDDIIRDMNALAEVARTWVHDRKRLAEDLERASGE